MSTQHTSSYDSQLISKPFIFELQELVRYKDLVAELVSRNIKSRYKRSVLGVIWTMLNPLLMTAVLTLVFSNLYQAKKSFILYILTGLVLWNFFQQVTTHAMSELVWGGSLLNRIYIPKVVFAVSALGTGLFNLILSMIPVFILMLILKTPLKLSLFFLPFSIILVSAFALGVGLLLSNLTLGFTDVFEIYQILLSGWYFLTPILYPLDIISPEKRWLYNFNPMYSLVEIFRQPIINGKFPDLRALFIATLCSSVTLIAGWWLFTRKADELAYRV